MKRITRFITALYLINISFNLFSQEAVYEWETGLCTCKGTFDSTKYNLEEIQNTYNYLWWNDYLSTHATISKIEELKTLKLDSLDKECTGKLEKLNSLRFIDSKFWNKLKVDRIREIEETCELRRITILGYSNPDTLNSYFIKDKTCNYYRNALILGGQEMLDAWIKLHKIQMSKNGNPEKLHNEFLKQYYSPDRLEYARIELMSFGWWNCANHTIFHVEYLGECETEFQKIFQKTNCECDEP